MKVKDVIKDLQKYNEDEEIIAVYWSRNDFTEEDNPITSELWSKTIEEYYNNNFEEDEDCMKNSVYDALWESGWAQADLAVEIMFEEVDAMLNYQPEETE